MSLRRLISLKNLMNLASDPMRTYKVRPTPHHSCDSGVSPEAQRYVDGIKLADYLSRYSQTEVKPVKAFIWTYKREFGPTDACVSPILCASC